MREIKETHKRVVDGQVADFDVSKTVFTDDASSMTMFDREEYSGSSNLDH